MDNDIEQWDLEQSISNIRTCLMNPHCNFYVHIPGPKKLGEYETLTAKLKKGAWLRDPRDCLSLMKSRGDFSLPLKSESDFNFVLIAVFLLFVSVLEEGL